MALVHYVQGNYDEALRLYDQAAMHMKALGPDHASTTTTQQHGDGAFNKATTTRRAATRR